VHFVDNLEVKEEEKMTLQVFQFCGEGMLVIFKEKVQHCFYLNKLELLRSTKCF